LKEYDSTGLLEYIRGATELLSRHGYYLSVHTTSRAGSDELNVLRNLVKQGISGIIYYPIRSDMNMTELFALAMNGYPLVTIDKYFDGFPIKYAASDNIDGGYKAVSHLIENGHKRIAFVAYNGFETATTIKNRYFGYCKALQENGLPIESHLTITKLTGLYADPKDRYHRLIVDLMNKGVTAVLAENDLIAIDLLKACIDLGIQVPRQLSIVGFDNTELSAHLDVPLTSVAQDFYNIGRAAASLLMEGLEQGTISSGPCLLPVRLVVRQSTSALRSAHL
jgi:DNA-binding LacI/PurR family transcriptional regulator